MPRRQISGPGPKSKKKKTVDESEGEKNFQSPEIEPNNTDYGFNYTSCSPEVSSRSHATKRTSAGNTNKSLGKKAGSISRNTRSSVRPPLTPTNQKKPRKQTNPVHRERLLWKQIRELHARTDNLTPKAPFGRLIREILMKESSYATMITVAALEALQTSSEIYLTTLFTDAYVCTLHRGRITLGVHDLRLVRFLRGTSDPGNKM